MSKKLGNQTDKGLQILSGYLLRSEDCIAVLKHEMDASWAQCHSMHKLCADPRHARSFPTLDSVMYIASKFFLLEGHQ